MTQVLKNKKGVTLVELLAVIVIMGIIAAIAVPAIGGLIENSRLKAVNGTIVTINEAARLYAVTEGNEDGDVETATNISELQDYVQGVDLTGSSLTFTVSDGKVTWSGLGSITYKEYSIVLDGSVLKAS